MWDQSLWELFVAGGPVMWPLLAVSILGLAVTLDRLVAFFCRHENLPRTLAWLRPLIRKHDWEQVVERGLNRGIFSHLAAVYVEQRHAPRERREEILKREGSLRLEVLETRVRWLGVLGPMATMLGLLGTVTGLVSAFHQVEILGGQVQPSDLASGIWEALLTTVFGLVIAIPCLTAYHACESRLDAIARQMSYLISYLDEWSQEAKDAKPMMFRERV